MSKIEINKWVVALTKVSPWLGWSDQSFASSIVRQWDRLGQLSPKQAEWAKILALRGMDNLPRGPIGDAVLLDIRQ